jgi:exosortase A-associated hydrolase 1
LSQGGARSEGSETPLVFVCGGARLVGILSEPERLLCRTGLLIVVGGPQYRAGSHRQFTLLARAAARRGIAALRFDYRGMGDSEGTPRSFDAVQEDLAAAVDTLLGHLPALCDVAIWGLCDAASAALIYAGRDARVRGLVLLNPWVYFPELADRARLRHYYLPRLFQRSLWAKIVAGRFRFHLSLRELVAALRSSPVLQRFARTVPDGRAGNARDQSPLARVQPAFVSDMLDGLRHFSGEVLVILSGQDQTADQFLYLVNDDPQWRALARQSRVCWRWLPEANHTFAAEVWRDEVAALTIAFLLGLRDG